MPASFPLLIWVGLLGTPVAIAIGQVLFKMSAGKLTGGGLGAIFSLLLDPLFILAMLLYGSATILWVFILRSVPLSIAYSFMAITFILVPIFSTFLLGEALSWRNYVSTGLIVAGLLVINSGA